MSTKLDALYRHSPEEVRALGYNTDDVADYTDFICAHAQSGKLLDTGCGAGWGSAVLAERGFDVTGLDLHRAFQPSPSHNLRFTTGSALALPFPDKTFDVVSSYAMLEHIPDPQRALDEMIRVIKPSGLFILVGPNLLSPAVSLMALTRYVWKNRPVRRILLRDAETPKHPFGNTLPEVLAALSKNLYQISRKALYGEPQFLLREPDMRPPFHGDNDASYLCTPIDIVKYLQRHGCEIIRDAKPGRGRWTRTLAGGTWIVARKPSV